MHAARAILLLLLSGAVAGLAQETPPPQQHPKIFGKSGKPETGTNWSVTFSSSDFVDYDFKTQTYVVTNGIVVRYGGATLSARKARASEKTGLVEAEGDVYLEQEGHIWRSEHLRYNFYTGEVLGSDFRTGQNPYFAEGKVLAGRSEERRVGKEGRARR